MQLLITYDVNTTTPEGRRRLRRVAKTCLDYGQRVQNSVFECLVDPSQYLELKARLMNEANLETDSLRFYNLGDQWDRRVEHYGTGKSLNPSGTLLV